MMTKTIDAVDSVGDNDRDSVGTYETPDEEESYDMNDDVVEVSDESSQQQENESPAIRHSARVPKPKSWMDYITFKTSLEPNGQESSSVQEALNDVHSEEWRLAMKKEIDALIKNQTWEVCSPPKNRRILKTKWVFKIKRNPQEESQRFKARLVARGYEQIQGEDYNETFCPVVRFNTLRCLFAVAARKDYDIDHLDVITAFLNGDLDEEIYIELPEGLAEKQNKK